MFEPNSIKSLLNRRQTPRISSAQSPKQTVLKEKDQTPSKINTQNQIDTIVEMKVMKEQIDNKIQNIRQWRNHQKELMDEKLKCNSQVVKAQNSEYIQALERQAQKQQKDLQKILKKLKLKENIHIQQKQEEYDSQKIFKVLEETEAIRQAIKSQEVIAQDMQHSQFLNDLQSLTHIFKKDRYHFNSQDKAAAHEKVDMQAFQKQMQQIDNQLKEIEYLLEDDAEPATPKNDY